MLQHSRAAVCETDLRSDASGIRLLLRNHGALALDGPADKHGRRGTGLAGLGYRTHTLGGTLVAGREDDSFTVEALLPTA
ncbi:hypothetical protein ACFWBV_32355 [Streptomyces sp. NPDC060030]|uniref:hypothetical protein n=1 Tax=Streptomyces sp. NPDC060030 TaxID=3347042 RepID=UPI00368EC29C